VIDLTTPGPSAHQHVRRLVVGVGDASAAPKVADVLRLLGQDRAIVVHGAGVDELPLDGSGVIHDVTPDSVSVSTVDLELIGRLGLASVATGALAGGTPDENAGLVEGVLTGAAGPRRDVVLLNAAAAFMAAGRVVDLADGVHLAASTLDAGTPRDLLARLRAAKQRAAAEQLAASAAQGTPA